MPQTTKTLAAACALLVGLGAAATASAAPDLVTEMSLQFSRYVSGVMQAGQGRPAASNLIAESATNFNTALDVATRGGQLGKCTYAAPPPENLEYLRKLGLAWTPFQRTGSSIRQNQGAVQSFTDAVSTINKTEPDVLEAAMVVNLFASIHETVPQNINTASLLPFRVERLAKNATRLLLEAQPNPEAAFLIEKESHSIVDQIAALQNGSPAMKVTKAKPPVQAKLDELAQKFKPDTEATALISSNLKALVETKQGINYVGDNNGAFYQQLQNLRGGLGQGQGCD